MYSHWQETGCCWSLLCHQRMRVCSRWWDPVTLWMWKQYTWHNCLSYVLCVKVYLIHLIDSFFMKFKYNTRTKQQYSTELLTFHSSTNHEINQQSGCRMCNHQLHPIWWFWLLKGKKGIHRHPQICNDVTIPANLQWPLHNDSESVTTESLINLSHQYHYQ